MATMVNVHDVIIVHVISADRRTYILYRRGNRKVILGPAGRGFRARPAGKQSNKPSSLPPWMFWGCHT